MTTNDSIQWPPLLNPAERLLVSVERTAMARPLAGSMLHHDRTGPADTRFEDTLWVKVRDGAFSYQVNYGWGGSSELLAREVALRLLERWEAADA